MMPMILSRCFASATAVILTVVLIGCASQVPSTQATVPATAIAALSDRAIVPGERIGPVRLAGKVDEITTLFGPGTVRGSGMWDFSKLQAWDALGLLVVFDPGTGNVLWISVEIGGSNPWAEHSTADGIRLGTRQQDLVSVMGSPERTVTDGGGTSFYYDRRGIRFTVPDVGSFAGKVGAIRVVWPSVPHGDTLVVPGKRISSIEIGAPVDQVLAILGGGYHRRQKPGVYVYYWPHLGLSFVERAGRVLAVRSDSWIPADAPGLRYSTTNGLGRGSSASEIKNVFGEPWKKIKEKEISTGLIWWIYRSQGISFGFDKEQKVSAVNVFQPEKGNDAG